jgi:hypothetical protein
MRYLIITLVALISSGEAYAFSCDDFQTFLKANMAEGAIYHEQHKSSAGDNATQCHFARDVFIPYTERTIAQVKFYVNCPKNGATASQLEKKLQLLLDVLETQKTKVCK